MKPSWFLSESENILKIDLAEIRLKNRIKKIVKQPSTLKDFLAAFILVICITTIYLLVYFFFGRSKAFDTNITAFYGAILAFSGVMTKQYLFKETIDYLMKWAQIEKTLEEIIKSTDFNVSEFEKIKVELISQKESLASYATYVKRELRIIPMIPILLATLYGAALLASDFNLFRALCLGLMLFIVTYLAKATISSNTLAIEKPDVDQLLSELNELQSCLAEKRTKPQAASGY